MHEIITTVGPASANSKTLIRLRDSGATDFRINLSHSTKATLESHLNLLKDLDLPVSLDTQGAQLRVAGIHGPCSFCKSDEFKIYSSNLDSKQINCKRYLQVNHDEFFDQTMVGDILKIDFDGVTAQIKNISKDDHCADCEVLRPGNITLNRALDIVGRAFKLDFITKFDHTSITSFVPSGLQTIYLSFASSGKDVEELNGIIDKSLPFGSPKPRVVSKIESKHGLRNLRDIAERSDGILIDRGDLSREISISRIPLATKSILDACLSMNKPCYVATNILDSMMSAPLPSRAEISDLFNLFSAGVSGIVLAAEVAIGKHPIESVKVVNHMSKIYQSNKDNTLPFLPETNMFSDLDEPLASWL